MGIGGRRLVPLVLAALCLAPAAQAGGAMLRPRPRPYPPDTNAACVLASHHPAHPGDEASFRKQLKSTEPETKERAMRVVVNEFMSLDGVVQAPGGPEEDVEGG